MRIAPAILFLFFSLFLQGQVSKIYNSTLERGEFLLNNIDQETEEIEKKVEELTASEIFLIRSGKITNSKELTRFPKSILDKVLAQVSSDTKIEFFIYNSIELNAYSRANGSVYFTRGLLNRLENEEELAFILAHEVAHIVKKHGEKSWLRTQKLDELDSESYANTYKQLEYSKEDETEADMFALEKLMDCGYDPSLGIQALKKLEIDSADYRAIQFEKMVDGWEYKVDSTEMNKRVKQKGDVFENIVYDDRFSTHPATKKRVQILEEYVEKAELDKRAPVMTEGFDNFKKENLFETLETAEINGDYGYGLYHSFDAALNDSTDLRLKATLLNQLYMVCMYKAANSLPEMIVLKSDGLRGYNYNTFIEMWLFMSSDMCKEFAYNLASTYSKNYPKNEDFLFWKSMMSELYFGKFASKKSFKEYRNAFPKGKYMLSVNERLKD